jgi:hypothetical protein
VSCHTTHCTACARLCQPRARLTHTCPPPLAFGRVFALFGEGGVGDSLHVVDHAQHVARQAMQPSALDDEDFPSL